MDKTDMQQISAAIRCMDPMKFTSSVDQFVKNSVMTEELLGNDKKVGFFQKVWFRSGSKKHDDFCAQVEQEASAILSLSRLSLNRMKMFQLKINGQCKGVPETERKTRLYFRKVRLQQMELLIGISEEVETIRDMIRQAGSMRHIIQQHTKAVQNTDTFMDIIGQRLSQRSVPALPDPRPDSEPGHPVESHPQSLLPWESEDYGNQNKLTVESEEPTVQEEWMIPLKIDSPLANYDNVPQATRTFHQIKECEEIWDDNLGQGAKEHLPTKAIGVYHDLIQDACHDIRQRKQRVITGIRDLKKGLKFLERLTTNGYSLRMKPGLDMLIRKHDNRRYEFQKHVRECRSQAFPGHY